MKTYWKSLEELGKAPAFKAVSGKEFLFTPEELEASEKEGGSDGVTRREFLRLMGASLVMATAASACRRPVEKIVPYLNKPEEITPGVPNWYASTCGECPAACGLLVKTREGRPIKLEGNADHPMNRGGLCARGQASILNLYDPDRLKTPLNRNSNGDWVAVSWAEADSTLGKFFEEIRKKKGKIRLLTDTIVSPSTNKLIQEFLSRFEDAKHISFEPLSLETLAAAQKESYGEAVIPHYHFERAKYILSFGADFLGTWLSPVEFTKQFSKGRKPENGMTRFVAFEAVPTVTGSNADLHIPVAPGGDEVAVALGIAHEIVVKQKLSSYASNGAIVSRLSAHSIEAVSQSTGMDPQILIRVAKELWSHRGESLVLGGNYDVSPYSRSLHVAVNFLNSILGNDGVTVDALVSPSFQSGSSSYEALAALRAEMEEGNIDCLLIYKANPVHALPGWDFEAGLAKVPVVVSLSDRVNETGAEVNWVLPMNHYLESWGDAEPGQGLFSLRQPTIRPMYETRSLEDTLLAWMGQTQTSFHDYLKNYWKENFYPRAGGLVSFNTFWETALRDGVLDTRKPWNGHVPRLFNDNALLNNVLPNIEQRTPNTEQMLVVYPTVPHFDGRSGNNGWLMELPDPVTKITWRNYVSVAPKRAKSLGLKEGDVVRLNSHDVTGSAFPVFELPVHIQPGLHEETLAVPLGFGHYRTGRIGDDVGVNAFQYLFASFADTVKSGFRGSFIQKASLEKTGKWIRLPSTQQHDSMEGRPIVRETTLAEYKKDPMAGNETENLPSLWTPHKYEGYRWGMAIDLNSCTGCSACMVACQSENNIPVVGEARVLKGREMHWIRIDRYYAGDEENPEVLHQPMLCQHCENAPCETVCPVIATLHNDEGLNIQVYNRCVGTRYCSNNCPYKVRRFNWFEYLRKENVPLAMVFNPDVTVREKGVMEKCTFCIQRIQEGKDKAKDFGRKVEDGEIKTACQQSCPADAIVFGDINDPKSKVSRMAKNERGYHVLADLNTRPSITYLTKVRNLT